MLDIDSGVRASNVVSDLALIMSFSEREVGPMPKIEGRDDVQSCVVCSQEPLKSYSINRILAVPGRVAFV
jgi:hypothetical protein